MNNTALLIVDVQRAIFERKDVVFNAEKLIVNINTLSQECRNRSMPVIFIQHESSGMFKKESKGWVLHSGLNVMPDDLFIGKKEGNSFFETPLHSMLKERKINRVIVCGLLSQLCVQRTIMGALDLGYETVLVSDAHSNSAENPEAAIAKVHKVVVKAGASLIALNELFDLS